MALARTMVMKPKILLLDEPLSALDGVIKESIKDKIRQIAREMCIRDRIRTALGAGWAVVLAAEMLGATSGVGFLITRGNEIGDTALILVSMFIIGIIGALLSSVTSRCV